MGNCFNKLCCCNTQYEICRKFKARISDTCKSSCCVSIDNHIDMNLILCDVCKSNLVRKLSENNIKNSG